MRYNHESYLPLGAFQPTLGKMKLFGGGGGGILDDFSDAIGTGGGDQGLLNSIDEGVQSVGKGLAEVDDFVNEEIPGGWVLPAVIAVAVVTGYVDPTLFASTTTGTAGLTAAETAALAESAALVDTAMAGAGGVGAGAAGAGTVGAGLTVSEMEALNLLAPETGTSIGSGTTIGGGAVGGEQLGTYQMGQGTSLSTEAANNPLSQFYSTANPEVSSNLNTVSNLVGGGAESNLASLNSLASNPLLPVSGAGIGGAELGSVGSIIGSGQGLGQQTLGQVLAPTGLSGVSVQDLASNKPVYPSDINLKDALRAANTVKNVVKALTPQEQALKNAQTSQQQMNMANMLRGTQMPQTALPPIYKQANPFNFGQQNQPVQDTTALANLLRTA
jgi:hypothetical protein